MKTRFYPYVRFISNDGEDKKVLVLFKSIASCEEFINYYQFVGNFKRFSFDYLDDITEIIPEAIPGYNSLRFFKKLYRLLYPDSMIR